MEHRKRLIRLREAQMGICAGCGRAVAKPGRRPPDHPLAPSFDHVIPRSRGGKDNLGNGLLKHRKCNGERGDRPATGCDRIWQFAVRSALGMATSVGI